MVMEITLKFVLENDDTSWRISAVSAEKERIIDLIIPFSEPDREEVAWFLEGHSIYDPFSVTRATACRGIIQKCAERLEYQLESVLPPAGNDTFVTLKVVCDQSDQRLFDIPWESLEQYGHRKFHLRRIVCTETCSMEPTPPQEITRILLLVARSIKPGTEESDISHRLISGALIDIISSLGKQTNVKLDIVRPGSLVALQRALDQTKGYYKIVHFDVHGSIKHGVARLHLALNGTYRKLGAYRAEDIISLLLEKGVKIVILNACRSAQTAASKGSNLASALTGLGMPYVIGMSYNLMSTTAAFAFRFMYTKLLLEAKDIVSALLLTRGFLASDPQRPAVLRSQVSIDDFIVPICYENSQATCSSDVFLTSSIDSAEFILPPQVKILGRDLDILHLEAIISYDSNVVEIVGIPGCGRTMFARHVCLWWQNTGHVEFTLRIDWDRRADILGLALAILKHCIPDNPVQPSDLQNSAKLQDEAIDLFNKSRTALILDNLDTDDRNLVSPNSDLHMFLTKLKSRPVLLIAQNNKFGFPMLKLQGLSKTASYEFVTDQLTSSAMLGLQHRTQRIYLDHCLNLLGGHPVALKAVFPAVLTKNDNDFRVLFKQLLLHESLPNLWCDSPRWHSMQHAIRQHMVFNPLKRARRFFTMFSTIFSKFNPYIERSLLHLFRLNLLPVDFMAIPQRRLTVFLKDFLEVYAKETSSMDLEKVDLKNCPKSIALLIENEAYVEDMRGVFFVLSKYGLIEISSDGEYCSVHPLLPFLVRSLLDSADVANGEMKDFHINFYRDIMAYYPDPKSKIEILMMTRSTATSSRTREVLADQFYNCCNAVFLALEMEETEWSRRFPGNILKLLGLSYSTFPINDSTSTGDSVLVEHMLQEYLARVMAFDDGFHRRSGQLHELEESTDNWINGGPCNLLQWASVIAHNLIYFTTTRSNRSLSKRRIRRALQVLKKYENFFSSHRAIQDSNTLDRKVALETLHSFLSITQKANATRDCYSEEIQALKSHTVVLSKSSNPFCKIMAKQLQPLIDFLFEHFHGNEGDALAVGYSTMEQNRGDVRELYLEIIQDSDSVESLYEYDQLLTRSYTSSDVAGRRLRSIYMDVNAVSSMDLDEELLAQTLLLDLHLEQNHGNDAAQMTVHIQLASLALQKQRLADALVHLETAYAIKNYLVQDAQFDHLDDEVEAKLDLYSILLQAGLVAIQIADNTKARTYLNQIYELCAFEHNRPWQRFILFFTIAGLLELNSREMLPELVALRVEYLCLLYDPTIVLVAMSRGQIQQLIGEGANISSLKDVIKEQATGIVLFELMDFVTSNPNSAKDLDLCLQLKCGYRVHDFKELFQALQVYDTFLSGGDDLNLLNPLEERERYRLMRQVWHELERIMFGTEKDCIGLDFLKPCYRKPLRNTSVVSFGNRTSKGSS